MIYVMALLRNLRERDTAFSVPLFDESMRGVLTTQNPARCPRGYPRVTRVTAVT